MNVFFERKVVFPQEHSVSYKDIPLCSFGSQDKVHCERQWQSSAVTSQDLFHFGKQCLNGTRILEAYIEEPLSNPLAVLKNRVHRQSVYISQSIWQGNPTPNKTYLNIFTIYCSVSPDSESLSSLSYSVSSAIESKYSNTFCKLSGVGGRDSSLFVAFGLHSSLQWASSSCWIQPMYRFDISTRLQVCNDSWSGANSKSVLGLELADWKIKEIWVSVSRRIHVEIRVSILESISFCIWAWTSS